MEKETSGVCSAAIKWKRDGRERFFFMLKHKYIYSLRKAARRGDITAMWTLGDAYESGFFLVSGDGKIERVSRNRQLAIKWLRRAVDGGCSGAMLTLASMYSNSRRRWKRGLTLALQLEGRAWNLGEELAANNMAITYSMLGDSQRCHDWLERYYDATGDGVLLALSLAAGYGTPVNKGRAIRILRQMLAHYHFEDNGEKCKAKFLLELIVSNNVPKIAIPISNTEIGKSGGVR